MRARTADAMALCLTLSFTLSACNFPALGEPKGEPLATFAAQTVAAIQTQETQMRAPTLPPPLAPTVPPSQPPQPPTQPPQLPPATHTPTPTEKPACTDKIEFVKDVTYPDGSELEKGQEFEKVWRLRNAGTCPWTAAYDLVFDHGDQLGGPTKQDFTDTVSPGSTVDLSVDLTAPDDPGSYQGFWKLRNVEGVLFGIGEQAGEAFWVKIEVLEPGPRTVTLTPDPGESGSVLSDGTLKSLLNVGDRIDNRGAQVFLAYDISGIPAGANIDTVEVDFSDFDTLDDPFGDLGCLQAYPHDYGTLGSGDYQPPGASGAIGKWCDVSELATPGIDDDFEHAMEDALGSDWFKIRLQFKDSETDHDGIADMVRLGTAKLVVTYIQP